MARNKYPEETVNLILETAGRLFVEKGYERTSIQDIVDNLGGLSKGAIYHHFKSKEEILSAVTDRMTEESEVLLSRIRDDKTLSGNFSMNPSTVRNRRICSVLHRVSERIRSYWPW